MLNKAYATLGILILALYGLSSFAGWELGTAPRQVIPADARQSPGGYRSYHFWHSGYRGGK